MKTPDFEKIHNIQDSFPAVLINPKEEFASKTTPTFESDILDKVTTEKIGHITFQLNHRKKILIVQDVLINKPKQGYGVSLYQILQTTYPDYQLRSGSMVAKSDSSQEKPNAVYLWEKLVELGHAESDGYGGFIMKK